MKFISLLTKNLYSSKPWYLCLLKEVHSPIFFQQSVFSNFILLVAIYLRNISYQNCSPSKKKERSSVQFSCSVVSDSLQPHELQHVMPPCPSPTPGVHSDSHPSSRWCHPAISSSVVPFSACPQSLPASVFSNESFQISKYRVRMGIRRFWLSGDLEWVLWEKSLWRFFCEANFYFYHSQLHV